MSVRDQLNLPELRTLVIQQEGLGAPWFDDSLAEQEAICNYNTGGNVTVTFGPFYIADTLGTPIAIQIIGMPEMKFSQTNRNTVEPTIQYLDCRISGFLDGVATDFPVACGQVENDPRHILSIQLFEGGLGLPFAANREIYLARTSLTYPWASLPEHGGI